MGLFRFLFKWSLQLTGASIIGYNYALKPEQQADLYGFYRSVFNSYRAAKQIYAATNQYKQLLAINQNSQEFYKRLSQINTHTAKRIQQLSRTNKGVYMRLGQYLGHLKYAYPSEFYNVLKQLNQRPNYQPQEYKYLKLHIQSKLGKKTRQVFQSLNTTPIRADVFHQVYKGQLAQNFLDINLKVVNPYSKTQTKYDFMFLQKAIKYISQFKQKNFNNQKNYPLLMNMVFNNVKENVLKQIDLVQQQEKIKQFKQKTIDLVSSIKTKFNRNLPVYIPHIYSQYTRENILIQQYFQGQHLSDVDSILKENYNLKNVSNHFIQLWNTLLQNNQLLIQSYSPSDIILRKSRPNEQGPYQFCLLNFSKISTVPQFVSKNYGALWRQFIVSKKLNPAKPEQRVEAIRKFYNNLSPLQFSLFLNDNTSISQLSKKANLPFDLQQKQRQLLNLSKQQISKQISKKLEQKKLLPTIKSKSIVNQELKNNYNLLKRVFQIEYQPWKLNTLFQTYKEAFRQQKHFGLV